MGEHGIELGEQYKDDDAFKAAARLHQSRYRADVLKVRCKKHGSKLLDADAEALLAYYDGLGVRDVLRRRFPKFSPKRDGDLLRSEHIAFNLFGPLAGRDELARDVVRDALKVDCKSVDAAHIEWAPSPKERYLGDQTSFDTFIRYRDDGGRNCGLGIEVKYTESAYRIGDQEKTRVDDPNSSYWSVTESSGVFKDPRSKDLSQDSLRQFWRNHLLGLSMQGHGDLDAFTSIVLYPAGNPHCAEALPKFRLQLAGDAASGFRGVTYEDFVGAIDGDAEVLRWRQYLSERYLF